MGGVGGIGGFNQGLPPVTTVGDLQSAGGVSPAPVPVQAAPAGDAQASQQASQPAQLNAMQKFLHSLASRNGMPDFPADALDGKIAVVGEKDLAKLMKKADETAKKICEFNGVPPGDVTAKTISNVGKEIDKLFGQIEKFEEKNAPNAYTVDLKANLAQRRQMLADLGVVVAERPAKGAPPPAYNMEFDKVRLADIPSFEDVRKSATAELERATNEAVAALKDASSALADLASLPLDSVRSQAFDDAVLGGGAPAPAAAGGGADAKALATSVMDTLEALNTLDGKLGEMQRLGRCTPEIARLRTTCQARAAEIMNFIALNHEIVAAGAQGAAPPPDGPATIGQAIGRTSVDMHGTMAEVAARESEIKKLGDGLLKELLDVRDAPTGNAGAALKIKKLELKFDKFLSSLEGAKLSPATKEHLGRIVPDIRTTLQHLRQSHYTQVAEKLFDDTFGLNIDFDISEYTDDLLDAISQCTRDPERDAAELKKFRDWGAGVAGHRQKILAGTDAEARRFVNNYMNFLGSSRNVSPDYPAMYKNENPSRRTAFLNALESYNAKVPGRRLSEKEFLAKAQAMFNLAHSTTLTREKIEVTGALFMAMKDVVSSSTNKARKMFAMAQQPQTQLDASYVQAALRNPDNVQSIVNCMSRDLDPAYLENDLSSGKDHVVEKLGKGCCNSALLVTSTDSDGKPVSKVFKEEFAAEVGSTQVDVGTAGIAHVVSIAQRNILACQMADAIGCADVLVQTTVGTLDGKFGIFMEKAQGKSPGDIDVAVWKGTAKLEDYFGQPGIRDVVRGNTMHQLAKLAWVDVLSGELDRHAGNYLVSVAPDGRVAVKGIDNDMCGSRIRYSPLMTELDEGVDPTRPPDNLKALRSRMDEYEIKNGAPPLYIPAEVKAKLDAINEKEFAAEVRRTMKGDEEGVQAAVSRLRAARQIAAHARVVGEDEWGDVAVQKELCDMELRYVGGTYDRFYNYVTPLFLRDFGHSGAPLAFPDAGAQSAG